MSIRIKIEEKYKEAIKSKNFEEVNTLRLIKSAIKDKDIENRTKNPEGIQENQILSLLQSLIKQRKDSIESFKQASRDDLVAQEEIEIKIISHFLPNQMNEAEIEASIKKIIENNNYNSIKDMGSLMTAIKSNYSGSIDMALAGKIAKSLLNN